MVFGFLTVASAFSACLCSPAKPQAVTIRVKNESKDRMFVNDSKGQLGVSIQRNVTGDWFSFIESPCVCDTCDNLQCNVCSCGDAGVASVSAIEVSGQKERTWDGVVQVSSTNGCGECVEPQNAPLNETFRAQLCYVTQLRGISVPDGGRAAGAFPNTGVTCVTREFQPRDGVVELGPQRGATCVSNSDCKGIGELCLSGSCTASCPSNDFPSQPQLAVGSPDNRGFFNQSTEGEHQIFTGTGTVTSASFTGQTLKVQLTRPGMPGEMLTGEFAVGFPPGAGGTVPQGAVVTVRLIDGNAEQPGNRAVVVRESPSGALLFAADTGLGTALLTASDLAPITWAASSAPAGCSFDSNDACAKAVHVVVNFSSGATSVEVDPGKSASLLTTAGTYQALNAFNATYTGTRCPVGSIQSIGVWRNSQP